MSLPEDLVGGIVTAAGCVRDIPDIFEMLCRSMQHQCQACRDALCKKFENLL